LPLSSEHAAIDSIIERAANLRHELMQKGYLVWYKTRTAPTLGPAPLDETFSDGAAATR